MIDKEKFNNKANTSKFLTRHLDAAKAVNVMDELPIWSALFGLKLLDAVDYRKNMMVLDIGFYTGFPLTELAMRLGDSSTVYGIDPLAEAVERARLKVDSYGITNVNIIEGVAESIPLADKSVDLITSNNGINNVADVEKVMQECWRIMKPNGQFIQTMNLDQSMFEFYAQLEQVFLEMGMTQEVERMYAHIKQKRPSVGKIKRLMEKQGFTITDVEYDQFNYKFADGATMLNHYFIRLAFLDSWIALVPADKVDAVFERVQSKLNEYAKRCGAVKLSIPFVLIGATKE